MAKAEALTVVDHELLELISSLVCLLDDGKVSFMNRAGLAMLGLTAEQAFGVAFETFLVDDYKFLLEAGWELLAAEEFLPLKLRRAGGALFDAEMRVRQLATSGDSFLLEVRDISKFVKSAEALREREERLTGVLRSVAEGIVTVNEGGAVETANPAAERMFGLGPGQLVNKAFSELMAFDEDDEVPDTATMMGHTTECLGKRRDGSLFAMEVSVSELRHGRQRLFTCILRDISERKESEDRIRRLAHHDHLTGLPNRNLLNDRMNHALARVRRHGGRMAVLYVDLDKFKPINDTLGHEAGDTVLREVATRLMSCVRSSDTVARVGGDEFVVVTEEIIRSPEAALVARKIVDALSRPVMVGEIPCTVGASIGIAVFPDDGYTMEEVCKAADIAMYRVKHSGRNGYCFFATDLTAQAGQ